MCYLPDSVLDRYSVISCVTGQRVLLTKCYQECYPSDKVIDRYSVISQRVLLADTVLPVRECYWHIYCYLECYQSESVIGRYGVTRSVTSQRMLLADSMLSGMLLVRECYWQIMSSQSERDIDR